MIPRLLLALVCACSFSTAAYAGCKFNYTVMGSDAVKSRIDKQIGRHVSDAFCKYASNYTIFIHAESYVLKEHVVGHALVGIRKTQGPKVVPSQIKSAVIVDKQNITMGNSYDIARDAAMNAMDEMMSDLPSHIENSK